MGALHENLKDSQIPGVVLIVGAPRSGTYLLVTKLNALFSMAIPIETHFIPLFQRYLPLWGDLRNESNRSLLLECIYDFLEIWTLRSGQGRDLEDIVQHSLLVTRPRTKAILADNDNYPDMVEALFREYADFREARLTGDKSAFFASIPLEEFDNALSSMKIIHVIRDGRDVSLSWRATWFGPRSLAEAAWLWRDHVQDKQRWGMRNPDRYLELRYEDLLDAPDTTLARVGDFLGLPVTEIDNRDNSMAELLAQGDTHVKLMEPLDPGNKEKWRHAMSERDQALFEYYAGDVLLANGYCISGRQINVRELLAFLLYGLAARTLRLVSFRHWRLWLKEFLPIAVWAARRLGFSLPGLLNRRFNH
ncbi:MAG: sulfotransferase [Desulfovibrionales bacterium]|nr:sulfotransferase [Desulfovibrionales bacterium]